MMYPANILTKTSFYTHRSDIPRLKARKLVVCLLLISTASSAAAQKKSDPLIGRWELNLAKSHYGGGAEPRKKETFICQPQGKAISCVIHSERVDGKHIEGAFTATYDGPPATVTGIPDVDQISLHRVDDSVVAATFRNGGSPVFAYRAERSADGRSLVITSVNPITRRKLKSVVVYDRVEK